MAGRALDYAHLSAGDAGPAISHALTRTDLVMYAGASGDFNPMHHDEIAAQQAGLPSVFGHGMFTAGLLATAITDFVGIGSLKSYRVRFTKQTWPGEVLTTNVTVREKRAGNEVVLDCSVVNDQGETKILGEAVAVRRQRSDRRGAERGVDPEVAVLS
jgi:acyl dehydratase